jgi:hypothetical protein
MGRPALIVSQSGQLTSGLVTLVDAQEYAPVSTLVTDRPESGQHYLSPETIEEIAQHTDRLDAEPLIVVDGMPHPGQLVDLRTRLQSGAVVDKRWVVWDRLAEANPVAATRKSLYEARLEHRQAANTQRAAATDGPTGRSGRVADSNERLQTLRDRVEQQQETARQRVRTSHTTADVRVVLVGRVGAPTTTLWSELTGEMATAEAGLPAQPRTAQATVAPHTVALTDTPGVPSTDGIPQWMAEALPGVITALSQSTCVLGVGDNHEVLLPAIADRFDIPCRSVAESDAEAAWATLDTLLPSVMGAVRLPYGDDSQAVVSELYDRTVVHHTKYNDAIHVRFEAAYSTIDKLRRRVTAADGELKRLDADEDSSEDFQG